MKPKTKIKDLRQVPFWGINPLDLAEKLELLPNVAMQPEDEHNLGNHILCDPPCCCDTEIRDSYESFKSDFIAEQVVEGAGNSFLSCVAPDPQKIGIFLKSIIQLAGRQECEDPEKWLTSNCSFYKDDIERELVDLEAKYPGIHIESFDFDVLCDYLAEKGLIATSWTTVRITRELSAKIHEAYGCLIR